MSERARQLSRIRVSWAVLLTVAALLSFGCGINSGESETAGADTTSTSTAEPELAEAEEIEPAAAEPVAEPTASATPVLPQASGPEREPNPLGAFVLREDRPILEPTPTPPPTAVPTPTTIPSPTPAPSSSTPAPTPTTGSVVPNDTDQTVGTGVLRTPTGVLVTIVGGTEGAWEVVTPCNDRATIALGEEVARPQILIDPGHGGSEVGASGPGGLTEKAVNLSVSFALAEELNAAGVTTLLLRTDDTRFTIRARTAMINALAPDAMISVHHNGGSNRDIDQAPIEIFHQKDLPEARRLGGLLHEELRGALDPLSEGPWRGTVFEGVQPRFNTSGDDLYGLLRLVDDVPSVITEGLYLDNAHGEALLLDPVTINTEAAALARGVVRWLTTDDGGTGFVDGGVLTLANPNSGGGDGCVDPPLQ